MIIILGSENSSKVESLKSALDDFGFNDYEIICIKSDSKVSSKPIGDEIIKGADNRNQASKKYANENNVEYDYLCAIEGGFSVEENGIPFIVTYVIVEDHQGKKSTGKSLGVRLRKDWFNFIEKGGSLNKVIEEITGQKNNKTLHGITGYLSNDLFKRNKIDKDAVMSAFIPFIYKEERDLISEKIKQL